MADEYGKNALLSYNEYLKVPELLGLQRTLSEPTSHDELLFLVIHQTYELWFKQILHEIDATIKWMSDGRSFRVNHSLQAIAAIEKILVSQIHILESMAQIGFLEFRDKLNPASGFQSMQFREIEFVSGQKDEKILEHFRFDEFAYKRLSERYVEPSLAESFWALLGRRGFDVGTHDGMKRGTGGSEGVGYLMTTLTKKFFPEIWEARTHLNLSEPLAAS